MDERQTKFTAKTELKSTASRTRFKGRLVSAGRIRNVLDQPGRLEIPAAALKTAVFNLQFDGLACFIDHAGWFAGPSLRNLFGVWTDVHWNEATQSVDGILNVYENELTSPIIEIFNQTLAGDIAPDLGVSIVFLRDL
ncbi:MAG: hypothetical protein ACK2T4_06770 [Candidatus Promineifilaceae bacterium]|jgi:hypothetical protein